MSISKHVDDHNTTEIALVSIRNQFCPSSRVSSGRRRRESHQAEEQAALLNLVF